MPPKVVSSHRGRSRTPVSAPSGSTFSRAESYRRGRADGEIQAIVEIAGILLKIGSRWVWTQCPKYRTLCRRERKRQVLKGCFVGALKDSYSTVAEVVEVLIQDVARLQSAHALTSSIRPGLGKSQGLTGQSLALSCLHFG